MFGYVTVNKPELKVKDYDTYRAFYCGLCRSLKNNYGEVERLTLSFDMTFLALVLTGLYEPNTKTRCRRCLLHPTQKLPMKENIYLDYAADMNILLSYYNLADNWKDDRDVKSRAMCLALKHHIRPLAEKYPRQFRAIRKYLKELDRLEKEKCSDLDKAAGLTGEMLAELFVYEEDMWAASLRRLGFFLGKFIYLMDAWEDLPEDKKNNSYNPWKYWEDRDDFGTFSESILNMMMSECSLAFEQLPILEHAEIIRNVLYAGVWSKYTELQMKRSKNEDPKETHKNV